MATKKELKQRQRTVAGEKGWPVRLAMCESAIRKQDEYVFKRSPRFVDLVVSATEARVKKDEKTDALDLLCERGCPRRELLYLLGMCENRGVTTTVKITGYDSVDLGKVLDNLRAGASAARAINDREFGLFLEMEEHSTLANFVRLPVDLEAYAALVKHAVKYIGGKSDFYLHLAKALLVDFVHVRTKRQHDEYVVDLLSVMFGEEYNAVEHRIWRGKYQKRLAEYRPDPADSPHLRSKKTLLECRAAIFYRMNILHSGKQYLRQQGRTVLRPD
jgi:hypothetical protein